MSGFEPGHLSRDEFPKRDLRFYRPAILWGLLAGTAAVVFALTSDMGIGAAILLGVGAALVAGLSEARLLTLRDRPTHPRRRV